MLKWLLTVLIGLVILAAVGQRLRLPGDFRIPVRGRVYYVPLASTVLLTLIGWGLGRVLQRGRSTSPMERPTAICGSDAGRCSAASRSVTSLRAISNASAKEAVFARASRKNASPK